MQCPLCLDVALEPKYVGATEVDICPRCRGLWLDRGELDRLLDDGRPDDRDRRDDRGRDDRGRNDRGRNDRDRDDRDRDDRDGRDDRVWERRSPRKKSKARRLADLFEEVLDF